MKYFVAGVLISFIFVGIDSFPTAAQSEGRVPVIVELFTSEGCSTCPPADKYLQKLVKEQPVAGVEIIPLSEHVDYWNRPEWTDKFSSAQFSNRQKYYAAYFKRTDIFTPQFVVDGTRELTAKDGNGVVVESARNPRAEVNIKIEKVNENSISLNVKVADFSKISNEGGAFIIVAITEDKLASNVSGGENGGHKLEHTAVARYLKAIGQIQSNGGDLSAEIEFGKDWQRANLSAVAFVQEAKSRRILGAVKISIK